MTDAIFGFGDDAPGDVATEAPPSNSVERKCEFCTETFTGAPTTAGKRLAAHVRSAHPENAGPTPPGRPGRKPESVTPPDVPRETSPSATRTPRVPATRKKTPTRDEWEKKLSLTLGVATSARAATIVNKSRLRSEDKKTQEAAARDLEMTDDECDALALPVAGVIAEGPGQGLNKKFGRQALDILDLLPAVIAVMSYNSRINAFQREYGTPRQPRRQETQPPASQQNGNVPDGPVPSTVPPSLDGIEFSIFGPGTD